MKTKKKPSRSKLVKKLDTIFSQFIRLRDSNDKWYAQCYTCWDTLHYKNLQNWHFITRGNYKYRWDENNCKPQCYKCNCIYSGNYKIYTSRMIDEYGKEKIDTMIWDKQITKISTPDIIDKIEHYWILVEAHLKRVVEK